MKKYTIHTEEPSIRKEQIERHKDFDKLLEQSALIQTRIRRVRTVKIIFGTAVVLLIAGLSYFNFKTTLSPASEDNSNSPLFVALDSSKMEQGETEQKGTVLEKKEVEAEKEKAIAVEERKQKSNATEKKDITAQASPQGGKKKAVKKEEIAVNEHAEEEISFQEAIPKGGMKELYAFFSEELIYPDEELLNDTEGTVILTFTVSKGGSAQEVQVVQSVSAGIDAEAIRLIKIMPPWEPARLNGKAVSSRANLPITFKITARHE